MVLEDVEVHLILEDTETEADKDTNSLSEGAAPLAKEEKFSFVSREGLRMKLPDELPPMKARSKLR